MAEASIRGIVKHKQHSWALESLSTIWVRFGFSKNVDLYALNLSLVFRIFANHR